MCGEQFDSPSAGFSQFLGERDPFFFHLIGEKKMLVDLYTNIFKVESSKEGYVEQLSCCKLYCATVVICTTFRTIVITIYVKYYIYQDNYYYNSKEVLEITMLLQFTKAHCRIVCVKVRDIYRYFFLCFKNYDNQVKDRLNIDI